MPGYRFAMRNGGTVTPSEAALAALQTALRYPLVPPSDPGFDAATRIWNGMITSRPALVAQPSGVADVIALVKFAREQGVLLCVKAGGHNIAGTAVADGALMIDLCRMRAVLVDPRSRTARVQGGCLLGDVDRETQVHGLATTLGFVSETGVGGLTLAGGYGYLTRRFGWSVDSLVSVDVVCADGTVRTASAEEHPDLFWALRGGGGNFGVVTSFTFRLYEVGPRVTGGLVIFDGARAAEVLAAYRTLCSVAPRELTCALTMRRAPPAPFVPKEWHGKPIIGVVACHTGPLAQADADLAPLRAVGRPIVDLVVPKPYVDQQRMLDATQPRGVHYYWKSEYLSHMNDAFLAVARDRGSEIASPMSQLTLFHVGGALSERAPDDGAVGNRDAAWLCSAAAAWAPDDPNAAACKDWARSTWEQVRPFGTGGSYLNFQMHDEGADRVRASYGANYERLVALKRKYDPDNLFRVNRNVSPV